MQHLSGQKIFAGAVVTAVVAAIVYGISLAGIPSLERERQLDERRVQQLQQINGAVNEFYVSTGHLPTDLSVLSNPATMYVESINDPETQTPYVYEALEPPQYRLCATFAAPTSSNPEWRTMNTAWTHPAGLYCFLLSAKTGAVVGLDPVRTPPIPAPPREGDPRDNPNVCSLMRSKSDGSMHCVACLAAQPKSCRDVAEDWEFYDTTAPGHVGIPYGCTMTETGCELVQ